MFSLHVLCPARLVSLSEDLQLWQLSPAGRCVQGPARRAPLERSSLNYYFPRPAPPPRISASISSVVSLPAFISLLKTRTCWKVLLFLSSSSPCHSRGVFLHGWTAPSGPFYLLDVITNFHTAKMKRIHVPCNFSFSFICCGQHLLATPFFPSIFVDFAQISPS